MMRAAAAPKRDQGVAIRPAAAGDLEFILALVPRFVAFELPRGRRRRACVAAIRADLTRTWRAGSADAPFFIAATAAGERVAFLHLQLQRDFFAGTRNCHISDLAVAGGCDGRGVGRALLAFAETWARRHHCRRLTLAVFPGNTRARTLYARTGFSEDLLRLQKPLAMRRRQHPRAGH